MTRRGVLSATLREHGTELYGRAFALTGHEGSADQLVEDALVTALGGVVVRRPDAVRDRALYEMHRSLAHRRPGRARSGSGPALEEIAEAPSWSDGSGGGSLHRNVREARDYVAEHPAFDADAVARVLADVATLAPAERACLVLRYLDGMAAPAIASLVGLEVDEVRSLLASAAGALARSHPELGVDPRSAAQGGQEFVIVEADR